MSWKEKIQNDLIIRTGDGKEWKPNWIATKYSRDYNVSEFNFPNVAGTLVKRLKPIGRKYDLEIYFQGEDHFDVSEDFIRSADIEKEWTVSHPIHGTIYVQPLGLSIDQRELNVTKITGVIMETIADTLPRATIAPQETVKLKVEELDELYEDSFTKIPTSADLNKATQTSKKHFNGGVPIIELPDEAIAYHNAFAAVNTAITTAIATPILFMRTITTFVNYPAHFTTSVKARLKQLVDQWETLKASVEGLFRVSSKQIFQNQSAANVAAMCLTASTPLNGNYTNSVDVFSVIDKLVDTYEDFLGQLDLLQNDNGGNPDSFIPNGNVLFKLNDLVNVTITSLFEIALKARQQRTFILEHDSDLINLTHRLYTLDPDDNNINEFIANNQFGQNDYLVIKKGTKIYYYI